MELIQGTTPTINITVKNDIPLQDVTSIWVYVSQQNKVKIDKLIEDVTITPEASLISLTLTQEDTLALRAEQEALFQIRMLLSDGTALATVATKVKVIKVYKDGVITNE